MPLSNEILEQNDFESLRLYDPNSQLHHEIGGKIRQIFTKLFQNTDINLDDFYFTGYDDDTPNAFFIEGSKTKNGKNIIAVSFGLIMALSNTEELAAIIGHESGHYLWSQLLGGRNTIFQERAADLRSVDLMMNAGYNPRNVISAQTKIFKPFEYRSPTLDVHGNPVDRIEDVKAHMTKISLERGYFPEVIPHDPEYDAFKKKLQNTRKDEPYRSFIDKLIYDRYNTTDISQIPRDELLFFLDWNINDICKTKTRLQDFIKILVKMDFITRQKTDTEQYRLEDLFRAFMLQSETNPLVEPYLCQILQYSQLDFFGPFSTLHSNIENLVNMAAPEWAAGQIIENENYISLAPNLRNFAQYTITFTPTPDIIGKKPFWVKLKEMNSPNINKALELVTQKNTRMLFYNENDYIYDEHGCIIAYGAERDRIVHEQQERENIAKANELFDNWSNAQMNALAKYNKIKDFTDGKINPKDMDYDFVMSDLPSWINVPGIVELEKPDEKKLLEKYIDKIDKNKVWKFYDAILSSAYYQDFKQYLANTGKKNPAHTAYDPEHLPEDFKTNSYILSVIHMLSGHTMEQEITGYTACDACVKMAKYYHQHDGLKLEEKLYANVIHAANDLHFLSDDDCNAKIQKYITKNILPIASKNPYFSAHMYDILANGIVSEINENKKELLENIIKSFGFKRLPTNEQELLFIVTQINKYNNHEIGTDVDQKYCNFNPRFYYSDIMPNINIVLIGIILLLNYMASGYKCNPVNIIKLLTDHDDSLSLYKELIAKFIPHDMFDSFSLDDKILLYEFLDENNGFSEEDANKNYFIQQIVNEIITYGDYDTAVDYAEKILMRKNILHNAGKRSIHDIEFANEREKLIEFYSDYWANKLGRDDNSPEFAERAQELADFLDFPKQDDTQQEPVQEKDFIEARGPFGKVRRKRLLGKITQRNFSKSIAGTLADKIANKIYAQENVTKILDSVNDRTVRGSDAERLDYLGRGAEYLIGILGQNRNYALATIEFLNNELTDKSVHNILTLLKNDNTMRILNRESLQIIHENFWAANLPVRAYLMNRLLNAYSTNDDDKLKLILDMFFTADSEYYNDAKLILRCIYNNLDDIERNLVLSALIASGKKSGKDEMTAGTAVGRGLKMFLQNKGPAFIKFGQLLSYLPNLDSDIRHELSTLRDKAKIPTRAELFEMLKISLPESEYQKITHVGKILGAGSFFVTVQVKYQDQDCVISLMRPNTQKLTSDGINMIAQTIQDMTAADPKYAVLTNIVNQARDSAYSEIDIEQDHQKYTNAVKIYESLTVHTPMGDYSPDVARWIAYGSLPTKDNAYKIMEMSPGVPLTSDELTEEERHDMALAYTTLELGILLSGNKWDTDRHAGQQNFSNPAFREFCIGIFDTGAQMNIAPNRRDKRMMGYLLYLLINGVRSGKPISEILTTNVQNIDSVCKKYGISTAYIDGVQRGLTALSDIMQYQKEIRDDNGNIVQQAKSLTVTDLENIAMAIMESGLIDKTLINTTKTHFVLDMLSFWKEKTEPLSIEKRDNPISITAGPAITTQIQTRVINKAIQELEKMHDAERQQEHLGVKIGLTERKPDVPKAPNDYGSRRA